MDHGRWQIPNSVLGLTSMILTDLDAMMSLSSCYPSAPLFLNKVSQPSAHVGFYSRFGSTRLQTQVFPIGPVPSAELHIVDILDRAYFLALITACRATSPPLSKLDASERRRCQRRVDQQGRWPIFTETHTTTAFVNPPNADTGKRASYPAVRR